MLQIGLEPVLIAFLSNSLLNAAGYRDINIQHSDNWLSRQLSAFN
jgi:hypothetical protein